MSCILCYHIAMNDEYYRDEQVYKIRPSNVKAKLKPKFKIENGYFSPYLLNEKLVPAEREGYCKYFYMESYHTVERRKVGGKMQNVTVLRSRKKYVEVPEKMWKSLREYDLKDYESARDEYEGTEYDVHVKNKYYNVCDFMLQQWDDHDHEQLWTNAFDLERVLNKLSDEDLDIYLYAKERRLKQKRIAAVMGLSEAHITQRMRFIEDKIEHDMLDDGERTEAQIRAAMEYNRFIRTGKCDSFADVYVYDFLMSMPQEMQLRYIFILRGQSKLIKFCFLWVYGYLSSPNRPVQNPKTALNKISYQLYKKHAAKLRVWARQLFIALEIEVNSIVRRFGIRDSKPDGEFIKTVQKAASGRGMTVAEYRDKLLFPHGREKIFARFKKYLKLHPDRAAAYKPPIKPANPATRYFVIRKK